MNTLELARSLNCTEIITVESQLKEKCKNQPFKYVLVIDFESTCWMKNGEKRYVPEIIEFPCVIHDVQKNSVIDSFQQYVMPTENPKLSKFCINLTKITQDQVDNGVPIKTCLMLFRNWLQEMQKKHNFSMDNSSAIFATWSDWDLGTCLKNECRRKQIVLPSIFMKWIDVRFLYRRHYMRIPKGLVGALSEVGLHFEGREHCGLHDAINTAKLLGKMIEDGLVLECTSEL